MDHFASMPHGGDDPRVLIIMTGGTICMQRSDEGFVPSKGFQKAGLEPRPSFNDGSKPVGMKVVIDDHGATSELYTLRTPMSRYGQRTRYCVYEFDTLLDSSSIDSAGWAQIASAVYRNYDAFDGFVILHGTDSLAYTCSALSFMLQGLRKPVVLSGSQAPISELQNDATDNLLGSLIIAGHFKIPEVCLFFNYRLLRGNRATKVSATEYAAFDSPNFPPLATMTAVGTEVAWNLIPRVATDERLTLQTILFTGHVACIRIFPGIRPSMINAITREPDIKGLILETFGAGNTPSGADGAMTKVLADAVKRDVVVVNITQCLSGNVSPLYAPAAKLSKAGVVFGYDMTSEAALTKLSYLLAQSELSTAEVREKMSRQLRGELTEVGEPLFRHPSGF